MQLLSIPYKYFHLPGTKSVPLEKMDLLFDGSVMRWRAHKKVMSILDTVPEGNQEGALSKDGGDEHGSVDDLEQNFPAK